jgi:hypothetical protein
VRRDYSAARGLNSKAAKRSNSCSSAWGTFIQNFWKLELSSRNWTSLSDAVKRSRFARLRFLDVAPARTPFLHHQLHSGVECTIAETKYTTIFECQKGTHDVRPHGLAF